MENKVVKTMIGAVALSGVALAGPVAGPMPAPAGGGYCDTLEMLGGSIYEGGFINSVKLTGRAHLNAAYTEGDVNSADFDDTYLELRRFRIGTKIQFLNDFTLVAAADMNKNSSRDDVRFGYKQMDELYLKYAFGDVMGLEKVSVAYGRMKHEFTAEGSTSSNSLKTVERSVIANQFYGGIRATGAKVSATSGAFKGALGVFSTESDSQEISDWNHGTALYGSLAYDAPCGGTVTLQGLSNDVSSGDDDRFGYDWAVSLAYENTFGNWNLLVNGITGEETNGDSTSGLVIMPTTFIVPDTVEFVARYEYATSDGDNIGLSRYSGDASGAGSRFDDRHALYAGLNYYVCGNKAKVQVGAEYETAEGSDSADADATTLWLGFRTSF
ncbi:MAG: porin [Akkermansiaceae bacterium]